MFSSHQSRRRNLSETPWADGPGWAAELSVASREELARLERPSQHPVVRRRAESAGGASGMPGETESETAERKMAEVSHPYRVVEPGLERFLRIRPLVGLLPKWCPRKTCLHLLRKRPDRWRDS